MELFEKKFYESMSTKVSLLNRITHFIVRRKGKQMRPMFVFLTAKMISKSPEISEKVYRAASIIELIHTATLIHDDVVDSSNKRRGFFSIKLSFLHFLVEHFRKLSSNTILFNEFTFFPMVVAAIFCYN